MIFWSCSSCAAGLVGAERAVALLLLEVVVGLAAQVADLDPGLFHPLVDGLDDVLATLLGERRDVEADHGAVDVRHEADVALHGSPSRSRRGRRGPTAG